MILSSFDLIIPTEREGKALREREMYTVRESMKEMQIESAGSVV